ncbi:LysR family transcriptional regulator [Streptomyces sp. NPDC089799]|uniref:LysR family transcriptional regulator n=1 Tax=Streptomyces sp. NPDC089799 TaxID=3155066 RepID=UPI003421A008
MELRDIEIFLVLAEELHFGRTAERLRVSQARVSQAVKKQERRIGALLFERTSRSVRLTDVGRQLRDDLQPVYVGLHDSLERARLAARGITGRLRVGMMPFNLVDVHFYWRAFRARYPQWELQVRQLTYDDPFGRLRAGDMDVMVLWLPLEEPDLTVGPVVCTDSRILAVTSDHELAGRTSARLEMFGDFQHAMPIGIPDYWENKYLPFQTPGGKRIERLEKVSNADELINLVAMGDIIHGFPSHVTRYWGMPNIRWIPIPDLPSLSYVMVWRTDAENDLVRALADTVRELGPVNF